MGSPDLSEFLTLSKRNTKRPCKIAAVKEALSDTERAQLDAACATAKEEIPATAITKWLRARGHDANTQQISAHRRRECTCHVGA
jgi:hypothetical protein